MISSTEEVFLKTMIQGISNNVLSLVKQVGELGGDIKSHSKEISSIKEKQDELSSDLKTLTLAVQKKMSPDRCTYLHEELQRKTKKEILSVMRQDAKGWVKGAILILKVIALISIISGGGTLTAKMIGM